MSSEKSWSWCVSNHLSTTVDVVLCHRSATGMLPGSAKRCLVESAECEWMGDRQLLG